MLAFIYKGHYAQKKQKKKHLLQVTQVFHTKCFVTWGSEAVGDNVLNKILQKYNYLFNMCLSVQYIWIKKKNVLLKWHLMVYLIQFNSKMSFWVFYTRNDQHLFNMGILMSLYYV